jgi:Sec-independent protein translocase protein TatA
MDFLNIGPLELIFILIIALIIFGPNDIVKAARSLGSFLRKISTSDGYRAFRQASKGMRDLPNALMREAGIEENDLKQLTGYDELKEATKDFEKQITPWTTPPLNTPAQPTNPATGYPAKEETSVEVQAEGTVDPQAPVPDSPPPESPFSQGIDE